ncbi:MAG: hypothetical protein KGL17_02340 [Betaproteobacteria bacterium]|nr:hypothetical protein [Betaproteobacteria bacterium]
MKRLRSKGKVPALPGMHLMLVEGEGAGGGGGGSTPPAPAPRPPEPETFSKDYVRELREENKGWRLKHSEAEQKAKTADDAAKAAQAAADAKVADAAKAANDRVIRAELKAAALKAGMVDLDGLKLADLSTVKINETTGEVEGAEALMEAMKKAKPYLFGAASTSHGGTPPKPGDPKPKSATEMTAEEYAAARQKAIRGR